MKPDRNSNHAVPIETAIQTLRGEKVILDADLARIYGVETRVLNQVVQRNREKFPAAFMFRLNRTEARQLNRSTEFEAKVQAEFNIMIEYVADGKG
jgi:hypothetical protein